MPNAIEIAGLQKTYAAQGSAPAKQALKGIDLTIPAGSIFGLLGPNGAGKSTMINILAGLVNKTAGKVTIWGFDQDVNPRQSRAAIGVMPQELNMDPFFTPRASLEVQAGLYGVPKRERWTDELLELVGLSDKYDAFPSQLSGGQKQRVAIARALANDPDVLLCDEATSALDPKTTLSILELLKELNKRLALTIVIITHEMQVIREICDQVVVIEHGEIVESGQVWSVFSNPQQQITQELLNFEQVNLPFELSQTILPQSTHQILKLKYACESKSVPDLYELLDGFNCHWKAFL